MLVMRKPPPRGKPTSYFLQRFGHLAKRNHLVLDGEELRQYCLRTPLEVSDSDLTDGYCIISSRTHVLGCGRLADGVLTNMWPKHFTSQLSKEIPVLAR